MRNGEGECEAKARATALCRTACEFQSVHMIPWCRDTHDALVQVRHLKTQSITTDTEHASERRIMTCVVVALNLIERHARYHDASVQTESKHYILLLQAPVPKPLKSQISEMSLGCFESD